MLPARCALRGLYGLAYHVVAWGSSQSEMRVGVAVPHLTVTNVRGREGVWVVFALEARRDSEGEIVWAAPSFQMGRPVVSPVATPSHTYLSLEQILEMCVPDCTPEIQAAAAELLSQLVARKERTAVACTHCESRHPIVVTVSAKDARTQKAFSFSKAERSNFIEAHRARGVTQLSDWEKNNYITTSNARGWWKGYVWFRSAPCFDCHKWTCHQVCSACSRPLVDVPTDKKKVSACACQWKTTQILLEDVLHVLHVHAHLHKEATRAFSEDCREGVLAHLNASTRKLGAELSRDDVRGIVDKLTGRTIVAPIATPGRMNYLFEFMGCAHTLMHIATCDMKNVSLRAQAHAGATSTSRDILASFIATHPCNLLRYFYTK